jgi:hypothetical protein
MTDEIPTIDSRATIRRTVRETIKRRSGLPRSSLLTAVGILCDCPQDRVADVRDRMEENGEVYLVDEEVRIP